MIGGLPYYFWVSLFIIFGASFIFAEVLGRLWVWIGTLTGVLYLTTESSYLTDFLASVPGIDVVYKISAFLVPQTSGPITSLIRSVTSSFLPDLFAYYFNLLDGLVFTMELSTGDTAEAIAILKFFGLTIIMPLLSALYVNAELLLILIIANTVWRLVRKQMKKRKDEKAQAVSEEDGKRSPETESQIEETPVMDSEGHLKTEKDDNSDLVP